MGVLGRRSGFSREQLFSRVIAAKAAPTILAASGWELNLKRLIMRKNCAVKRLLLNDEGLQVLSEYVLPQSKAE